MRKPLVLIAAASLATGTLAFVGSQSTVIGADYNGTNAEKTDTGARAANLPQGITPAAQTDTAGIQRTLGTCADDVASGNWTDLSNHLARPDQQRINFSNVNHQNFDKTLAQFKQDWRAKYNQDFDLAGKEQVVFGEWRGFDVVQGEVTNPALLSNWPVEPRTMERAPEPKEQIKTQERTDTSSREGMHASAAGPGQPSVNIRAGGAGPTATVTRTPAETKTEVGGQPAVQLDRGTPVAVVTFPAQPNAPETTVSLVREGAAAGGEMHAGPGGAGAQANMGTTWKVDIPDSIDSQKLVDNLDKHLSEVSQMRAQWPDDVNQGYRFVSQHMYAAMYDTGGTGMRSGDMQPGGMERSSDNGKEIPSHSEK